MRGVTQKTHFEGMIGPAASDKAAPGQVARVGASVEHSRCPSDSDRSGHEPQKTRSLSE